MTENGDSLHGEVDFCAFSGWSLCWDEVAIPADEASCMLRRRADVFCRNACDLRGLHRGGRREVRPPPIQYKTSQSGPTLPLSVTWLGAAALAVNTQKHRN